MLTTPRVSEKSYKLHAEDVYVFDVPKSANKAEIIAEIEKQYGVKIKDARMLVAKGKAKTVNRGKRSRPTTTHRKDTKKAYVRVAEGKIEIAAFEEVTNQVRAAEAEKAKDEQKVSASTETKAAKMFAKRRTGRRGDR